MSSIVSVSVMCGICRDDFATGVCHSLTCGHHICIECLDLVFQGSARDRTLFPPSCCNRPISIDAVRNSLDVATIKAFDTVKDEFGDKYPLYCHMPTCSAYVPKHSRDDAKQLGTCLKCDAVTCMNCKRPGHESACEKESEFKETIKLAKDHDWQSCPKCGNIVEKIDGCNHISCSCGFDFCYICAASWIPRTCQCDQYTVAPEQQGEAAPRRVADTCFARGHHNPEVMINLHRCFVCRPGTQDHVEMYHCADCHTQGCADCWDKFADLTIRW